MAVENDLVPSVSSRNQPLVDPLAAVSVDEEWTQQEKNDDDDALTLSVNEAMERLGMGWFQYRVFITVGLCFSADAIEVLMLSYLSVVLQTKWDLTDAEKALVTSCVFDGAMVGSVVFGPLADRFGRRPAFLLAALLISFFGVLTATTNHYLLLLASLGIVGVGIGGLTVPYDTLAEFLPNEYRGTNLLALQYFWTLGTMMALLAAYLSLRVWGHSWRLFVVLCSIPCWVSVVVGWYWVPESPLWLCAHHRSEEAIEVFRKAAHQNGHPNAFPIGTKLSAQEKRGSNNEEQQHTSLRELFRPEWRWIVLHLCVVWGGFGLLYYGTVLSITQIFAKEDTQTGTYSFDFGPMATSASAELVGVTVVLYTVDRWGRIPSQSVSYLLGGVSIGALCLLSSWMTATEWLEVVLAFLARMFMMSATCVTWIVTPEVLPTEIRATGHGLVNAIARITGSLSPFLIAHEGSGSPSQSRNTGILLLCISIVVTWSVTCLPETKGQSMGSTNTTNNNNENNDTSGGGVSFNRKKRKGFSLVPKEEQAGGNPSNNQQEETFVIA